MPPYKGTALHAFRIPDELWQAARKLAAERGESLSDVVRGALREYVTPRPPQERRAETRR